MMTQVRIASVWPDQLQQGLFDLQVDLTATQQDQLLGYLGLLSHWNRSYNLTAVRDPALMVRRHLLDSLSILPWVDRGPVLDVGTGAGLPGIPLAIARPHLRFTLLDANGKKTRFVQQVVGELGLTNVEVVKCRAESLDRPAHYAIITSRAYATLIDLVLTTQRLLAPNGCWLAMKGASPTAELSDLPAGFATQSVELTVPEEPGRRHLVVVSAE